MITVHLRVTLPDGLFEPFMQAIRDFDIKYDPHHQGLVQIETVPESDWPAEKMAEALNAISPRPQHMWAIKKCLCIPGCSVNGECPIHGDAVERRK